MCPARRRDARHPGRRAAGRGLCCGAERRGNPGICVTPPSRGIRAGRTAPGV
ncbi:protein of unassigned function [Methylobacterium oryzae CBMB20]|uniref:Protein of unassigned function n=1 Tax=Methylobacterium oryzae CBMB20 TaxID=693986 RepID=A0A089P5W9_9HYPH|nr:protein of unassigned function [Methylobacterium oryzae CBMB20]